MDVIRRHVFQVNTVDFRTHRQIMRHARLGYKHVRGQIRIISERFRIIRFSRQYSARGNSPTCRINLFELLLDFE